MNRQKGVRENEAEKKCRNLCRSHVEDATSEKHCLPKHSATEKNVQNLAKLECAEKDELENQVVTYAANTIVSAREEILNKINNYQTIEDLDTSPSTYSHEVDYYEKAKAYYNPDMSYTQKKILIAGLVSALLYDTEE